MRSLWKFILVIKMNNNDYELYMFKPEIYPFSLWIYIGSTDCGIQKHFNAPREFKNDEAETINVPYGAFKHGGQSGYIIWFKSRNRITFENVCHEVIHTIMRAWQFIGEEPKNSEPLAYLAGWVARCCWMIKQKKADDKRMV